jgi:hypothetical protein
MEIIGGLDVHRKQITFDYLQRDTGEVNTGQIRPATRENSRTWLSRFEGEEASFALEATTGWRFVVEELERAGLEAKLAEPADTRAMRGKKKRAKTDRLDAPHLRELLRQGRLPESWIPPSGIQDLRTLLRTRKTLVDERTAFLQRIHAQLFHHGHHLRSATCSPVTAGRDSKRWSSAGCGPQEHRTLLEDDRSHKRGVGADRRRDPLFCPPASGIQGAHGSLRHRGADKRSDPGRARGHQAL